MTEESILLHPDPGAGGGAGLRECYASTRLQIYRGLKHCRGQLFRRSSILLVTLFALQVCILVIQKSISIRMANYPYALALSQPICTTLLFMVRIFHLCVLDLVIIIIWEEKGKTLIMSCSLQGSLFNYKHLCSAESRARSPLNLPFSSYGSRHSRLVDPRPPYVLNQKHRHPKLILLHSNHHPDGALSHMEVLCDGRFIHSIKLYVICRQQRCEFSFWNSPLKMEPLQVTLCPVLLVYCCYRCNSIS